jgi:wyosine [tRNA(Phe)-imidazoG37] synthetase (radical SAM superfamily)
LQIEYYASQQSKFSCFDQIREKSIQATLKTLTTRLQGHQMKKKKFVYGPVPSRRLGQSLGIDPIPLKTCNWNCVYCQLGRTMPLINERRAYFPREDILAEVKDSLDDHYDGEIDWITFVGSGEPTLHNGLGWLIREVKNIADLRVAVITNGALLYLPEVRQELLTADAILPSLDAGKPWLYRKINRPHPEISFERFLDGMIAFREEYYGSLWVEVMLVHGLNDSEIALNNIAVALQRIRPDEVHINLPTRPPAETWVQPPDDESLLRARAIFGEISKVVHPINGTFDLSGFDSLVEAVIGIITRHPMREEEVIRTLECYSPVDVSETLAQLHSSGQVQVVERYGTRFWSAVPAHFPNESKSQRTAPDFSRKRKSDPIEK